VSIAALAVALVGFLVVSHWRGAAVLGRNASWEGAMEHTNRLIHEKSPYLLQHAHNPVDWYPWGPEAFEAARREDKPIFLSVGYSTCHWCHVMARQSFENEEIARLLNDNFVSIKVDREERPDIDQVYMSAVNVLTGRGGWPMSVFLLPDGRPFAGGMYFPPERFELLLGEIGRMWRERRPEMEEVAAELATAVQGRFAPAGGGERPALDRYLVVQALENLRSEFEAMYGGSGGAPKFPPHQALSLLFAEYRRNEDPELLQMATRTLEAMALGGIHDQIGGGFHRYATDSEWLVPHFEKMLYDNALLLRSYADAYRLTDDPFYRELADDIYDWADREMRSPEGGFYSALDAESEGVEGKFYVWTREQICDVVGGDECEVFCRVYQVQEQGNYREEASDRVTGDNILHLAGRIPDLGPREGVPADDLVARMVQARAQLLAAREQRVRPRLDDKVLTSWNGLMIGSLAYAGRQLGDPRYTAAAEADAEFLLNNLRQDGRLLRRWREGEGRFDGYLDDYVFLSDGLLELYETTGNEEWLGAARELMDTALELFWDESEGGFFFTTADSESLFVRPKEAFDAALPSGNGMASQVLLRLAEITGEAGYAERAGQTLRAFTPWMQRAPSGTASLILAASRYLDRVPREAVGEVEAARPPSRSALCRAVAEQPPVRVEAAASATRVRPGGSFDISLAIRIADGWHINSHQPLQSFLIPTTVEASAEAPVTVGEVHYPTGRETILGEGQDPLSLYAGTVLLVVPVTVAEEAEAGSQTISLTLHYQACDDRSCLAPETLQLDVLIEVGP